MTLARRTGALAAIGITAVLGVALGVSVAGFAQPAREALDLPFERPRSSPSAVLEIATTNLRFVAAPLLAAWAVRRQQRLRLWADTTLASIAALNILVVGTALAAYGSRLAASLVPHAPVELAALAVAGSGYIAGRRGELADGQLVLAAAVAVSITAFAAVLETYVSTGSGA